MIPIVFLLGLLLLSLLLSPLLLLCLFLSGDQTTGKKWIAIVIAILFYPIISALVTLAVIVYLFLFLFFKNENHDGIYDGI